MKKTLLAGFLIYLTLFCATAVAAEKIYSFKDFSDIQFSIPGGTLFLSQSDEYQIVVMGTEDQIEDIVIEKNGTALSIEQEWSFLGIGSVDLNGVEIRIAVPILEAVATSSAGNIRGLTPFSNSEMIKIHTSSAGDISLSVQAGTIEATCSSAGSIKLNGKVASLLLESTSSGDIEFSGEVTESLRATTSSAGSINCKLDSNTTIPESRLKISSMGNITVTGKGNRVIADSSSSGDLLLKDFQCSDMTVNLTSSGSAFINVTGNLDMRTSSSGRIVSRGIPRIN